MKNNKLMLLLTLLVVVFASCSKEDSNTEEEVFLEDATAKNGQFFSGVHFSRVKATKATVEDEKVVLEIVTNRGKLILDFPAKVGTYDQENQASAIFRDKEEKSTEELETIAVEVTAINAEQMSGKFSIEIRETITFELVDIQLNARTAAKLLVLPKLVKDFGEDRFFYNTDFSRLEKVNRNVSRFDDETARVGDQTLIYGDNGLVTGVDFEDKESSRLIIRGRNENGQVIGTEFLDRLNRQSMTDIDFNTPNTITTTLFKDRIEENRMIASVNAKGDVLKIKDFKIIRGMGTPELPEGTISPNPNTITTFKYNRKSKKKNYTADLLKILPDYTMLNLMEAHRGASSRIIEVKEYFRDNSGELLKGKFDEEPRILRALNLIVASKLRKAKTYTYIYNSFGFPIQATINTIENKRFNPTIDTRTYEYYHVIKSSNK